MPRSLKLLKAVKKEIQSKERRRQLLFNIIGHDKLFLPELLKEKKRKMFNKNAIQVPDFIMFKFRSAWINKTASSRSLEKNFW